MKKASFVVHSFYNNNKIFDLTDPHVNRDNCLYSYSLLRDSLKKENFELATSDIHLPEESDIVFYNEAPTQISANHDPEKSFLLLFETELIRPKNWDLSLHKHFKKIFTWNDSFIDNDRYFKMNFSHLFPSKIKRVPFQQRKFCTLIAGNKSVSHPLELYSKRLETIDWFEKNHPDQFDYYGMGWNQLNLGNNFLNKVAKKLKLEKIIPSKTSPCYKGTVDRKIDTLSQYQFSICYENAEKISGYITEKIFDSFFAGCIPIYWGAPNINDHIPKECFIDRRDFSTHQELYGYLSKMSESDFNHQLDKIDDFLNSSYSKPFSAQHFSETLCLHVKNK